MSRGTWRVQEVAGPVLNMPRNVRWCSLAGRCIARGFHMSGTTREYVAIHASATSTWALHRWPPPTYRLPLPAPGQLVNLSLP